MRFNIVLLLIIFKFVQCTIFESNWEEIRTPWSAENDSSSLKRNSQYIPKFHLDNVKIRKLKRFDGIYESEFNKSSSSAGSELNAASDVYTNNFNTPNVNSDYKNEKSVKNISRNASYFGRHYFRPKNGIIYYVNAPKGTYNQVSTTQKRPTKMYFTKEEHEQEILKLKQKFELQCGLKSKKKRIKKKKVQVKKEKPKPSKAGNNFVQAIGDVLDSIYETVTDSGSKKVNRKRLKLKPNVPKQKKELNLRHEDVTSDEILKESREARDGNDFVTQLEIPQSLVNLTLNQSTTALPTETNTNSQEGDLVPVLLVTNSNSKRISKRSVQVTESPKIQYTVPHGATINSTKKSSKNHLTTRIHVTSEYDSVASPVPKTVSSTTEPCKKSKQETYDDNYYYDFDDFFYDDYDYSKEEKDDVREDSSLSVESKENTQEKEFRTKSSIKRTRQRKNVRDYDYYGIFNYIHKVIKPIRRVIRRLVADTADLGFSAGSHRRKSKKPQSIHDTESNSVENSFTSWFSSWFSNNENDNTLPETLTTEEPGWFDSWFNTEERTTTPRNDKYEGNDDWFFGWFNPTPKVNQQVTTTSTTSVPILTISDPMKNPQKWIGILAQHIVNSTAKPSSDSNTFTDIPQKITYDKYQIWRLKPNGEEQVQILEDYKNSKEGNKLQWLQGPSLRGLTDVLIPPKLLYDFQGTLNFEGIDYEVLLFDLGKAILYEETKEKFYDSSKLNHTMTWRRYYSYNEILKVLESIRMENPAFVDIIHIGRSYEGRPLVLVKISLEKGRSSKNGKKKINNKRKTKNPGIFIEAGSHGREWIGPAVATWIINEIAKVMNNNGTNSDEESIKKATWYILPVLNPDGYEYSREFDRMWRKSRSKHSSNVGGIFDAAMTWFKPPQPKKMCYGVDLDRNWEYQWSRQGSSKSPCNEFFAGPSAFSEPETKIVSRFLMEHRKRIKLFTSLHSYGQIISYPTKINSSYASQKLDDLIDVAMVGIDGLRKSGSSIRYKIDSNNEMLPPKSGSSDHFAMFEAGIPFSYTIHLGDNGVDGFLLPGSHIESVAKDAFEIIKAMVEYI